MLKRYPRFLISNRRISIAQKSFLCQQGQSTESPKISTRYGVEGDHYRVRRTGAILKNPSFHDDENYTGMKTPVQMAKNLLVDLMTSDRLVTYRPLSKVLPWVPCVFYNKIQANKNTECLDEFISKGGWSNWLMSMDGLVASKKIMPYHLLLAIKWTMKLHKLLIDTGQGYCVNNIFNLTDGVRLISWLTFIFGNFEPLDIANVYFLVHHTCYIVEHLDKNTSDGCLNRSLIDGKLKIEIRRNMIRIYNSFKMDSLCRQRTADEIKTFAKTFYVLLCKLEVFDRKFYDPSCVSLMGKVDNCFLKENNLSDIYELESYLATIDVIKAKLTDDFIHISVYMSKLQYQTTHFAELVYLMQFAELVNLLNLVDDERQWCELFLFQLNIFASLYLNKVNGTSASILRLFLLISLKNDRLDAFNGFKKNHFEGKFRQNLPFLSDGQLTEMKALVEDKLNVNFDSLYK